MSLHHRLVPAAFALLAIITSGIAVFYGYQAQSSGARVVQLERESASARNDAAQARALTAKLQAQAAELDAQLGNIKTRATAVETKSAQLNRELASTKSSLSERQQREVALLAEIESLRQRLPSSSTTGPMPAPAPTTVAAPASASPAWTEETAGYRERIAALEIQLTELLARALAEPGAPAELTPVAAFKVVRVGAQEAFVIVDYGREHGAAPGDTLFISRGTSVLARVEISDARPRYAVARVLPTNLKGQLQTGDIVLLAK